MQSKKENIGCIRKDQSRRVNLRMNLSNSTNLRNRVNKLYLPRTKALYPLYELISNSIHAIQERNIKGVIGIKIIRHGNQESIGQIENLDQFPIFSIRVVDNGIGLNDENMSSFAEFDSEKKIEIGGKGVGRLVCLKAFRELDISSIYKKGDSFKKRSFKYKRSKEGFENYKDEILEDTEESDLGTIATLHHFEEKYSSYAPSEILEIGRRIVTHFQLYFIQEIAPEIKMLDQKGNYTSLSNIYANEFEKKILQEEFVLSEEVFKVYISKSHKARSHRIHYCGNQRTVKDEGLSTYIQDFTQKVNLEDGKGGYYFQVFVVGDYLDHNVNEARTGFNFANDDQDTNGIGSEITLSNIRKETLKVIETQLEDYLVKVRKEKMETYLPIIEDEYPNYHSVVSYNRDEVSKLPSGLSKEELDLKLYEIESRWRIKVKLEGSRLIDPNKDITELDDYKDNYEQFLTEFNEIGQADLARYVVHRRSVLKLLDQLIVMKNNQKFENEDIVHSLFFPVRENMNSVSFDKQNLWLIDERLTFNSLLASDKMFKQVEGLNSDSRDRMDIVVQQKEVYENATLFAENKIPYESFTIIEFKRPERDDYKHGNKKKDPVKQVRSYIKEIISGKSKVKGKKVSASKNTPFYCYIIADITKSLEEILEFESFDQTPDGLGYFRFYDTKTSRVHC